VPRVCVRKSPEIALVSPNHLVPKELLTSIPSRVHIEGGISRFSDSTPS
jgi:hypothetical protein